MVAANTEDPQTLRMVAGAFANLFGNGKLLILSHFSSYHVYLHCRLLLDRLCIQSHDQTHSLPFS